MNPTLVMLMFRSFFSQLSCLKISRPTHFLCVKVVYSRLRAMALRFLHVLAMATLPGLSWGFVPAAGATGLASRVAKGGATISRRFASGGMSKDRPNGLLEITKCGTPVRWLTWCKQLQHWVYLCFILLHNKYSWMKFENQHIN